MRSKNWKRLETNKSKKKNLKIAMASKIVATARKRVATARKRVATASKK